ncbi:MAG TPA: hypothetical protein VGO21_05950 [Candidatus Paceibacterota bacterium]|jgi:hypothetical protein|nr:hypothetical protein [Candidatus Paceibacterota bacterium]
MRKVLLLPGWMTSIKLYEKYNDFNICFGELNEEDFNADYVIGVSLGAMVALRDIKKIKGKVILINPPLPKKNFFVWFVHWIKYIKNEGLFLERQKFTTNPIKYIWELFKCIKLLSIDFCKTLDNVSLDKVTVIRGKSDIFFCDEESVKFLRSKDIRVVEFEGGHNLSPEMEKTMNSLTL